MIEETKDPTRKLHSAALQVIYEKMQSSLSTRGIPSGEAGRSSGQRTGIPWIGLVLAAHAPTPPRHMASLLP